MPCKNPCGICFKPVAINHKAIFCDCCNKWVHITCNNTTKEDYQTLTNDLANSWCFRFCISGNLPYMNTADELMNNIDLENTSNNNFLKT